MKVIPLIFILYIFILGCSSQTGYRGDPEETNESRKKDQLSIYNLDPETYIPKEFGIFDFVNDDLEIIRLETCMDCFIGHPLNMVIEDEFILVGSITGSMKPGELLRFSRDGKFEYKFGNGGKGHGEHVGWDPRKVRFYPEDNTVMVYWGGGHSTIQLFDLKGNFKEQIDIPHPLLMNTAERLSDSTWFVTGQDDWGIRFSRITVDDSIRFSLFSTNGELISEIPRKNFPTLNKLQEAAFMPWPLPYKYNGTWKFNLKGNDTLFSIINHQLKPDAILATPTSEYPLNIRVLRETDAYLMLVIYTKYVKGIKDLGNGSRFIDSEIERYFVLVDKSTKKSYSIKLLDDVFFILDNFKRYDGDFMEKHFEWKNDRLTFAISANEWIQRAEKLDTSKLRPVIQEKLKILEGLKEDDNPIVFTFTLKDEIDFE
ncbi:MAG: 6-bladed beta-propeller [Bacteroidota bacterium]